MQKPPPASGQGNIDILGEFARQREAARLRLERNSAWRNLKPGEYIDLSDRDVHPRIQALFH
jgi:hypothetical protein